MSSSAPWENITELPFNSDEFSTAHPALSKDGKRLFFASDRPGSMTDGNNRLTSDIWYVTIDENGEFSEPVNVKSVNTIGNDLFPFISDNGDFYYSSTGHQGLGGLDVYVVQTNDKGMPVKEVINIGKPVNSSYDDFAFIIKDSLKTGYFSSNRKSGKGLDDIYSFKQTKDLKCVVDINGIVTNQENGELMPFATVTLFDKDNKKIKSIVVGEDAAYSFVLECGQNYSIRAQKEDFSIAEEFVQTPKVSTTLEQPLAVAKAVEDKVVDIKVGDDLNDILDLNMIYFDFDKHNIRYDAEIELQKVLAFMNAYPNSIIDIRSHTDSRATDGYNIKLSDRRAKSTRAYLIMKGIKAN
ncbi:OmpA family protein, partial [Nonlabens ulvanivorans]|uniref:OmpA family protein n=1 Tax=Nonlabens ulvanivorans TaxID=906888 RepID=UPI003297977B